MSPNKTMEIEGGASPYVLKAGGGKAHHEGCARPAEFMEQCEMETRSAGVIAGRRAIPWVERRCQRLQRAEKHGPAKRKAGLFAAPFLQHTMPNAQDPKA